MKNKLIFIIILLAAFLRLYNLNKVPPALFSDEVDLGYQAYSFLKTGKDYFGNFLPVHFHSFADFRTPLYLYAAVPTIAIFGLNEWGVRLPAAIFGSLTVLTLYLLVLKLSKKQNLALFSALILAITPWHIHYSRAGFEVTSMLFFLTLGFWLFFNQIEEKKGFFLSALTLGLCLYTYAPVKLFLPLLLGALIILKKKEIYQTEKKKRWLSLITFLLIILPITKSTFLGQGNFRFGYLNIFSFGQAAAEVDEQRLNDVRLQKQVIPGTKPPLTSYIFHNKPISWFNEFVSNYLSAFSLGFIFTQGDSNLRHSLPNFGLFLLIFAPFLLIGLVKAAFNFKQNVFWFLFLFLSPVASSLTSDGAGHASRLSFLIVPLVYFSAYGLIRFLRFLKQFKLSWFFSKIFIVLLIFNFLYYLHFYYYHYPSASEEEWHYGLKQVVEEVVKIEDQYPKVYFSSSFQQPLIFYLFWSHYPPEKFNAGLLEEVEDSGFKGKILAKKYYFGQIKSFQPSAGKSLLIVTRNELGHDLEKEDIFKPKIIKKIFSLNGEPRFYLLENDK